MKKGQSEILGFLVIVLLLLFAGLFFLIFSLKAEPESVSESVEYLQMSDMLTAMTQYTVCENTDLEDVMQACNENRQVCEQDSCILMENEIEAILDAYDWKSSDFELKIGNFYIFGACSGEKIKVSKPLKGFEFSISGCS